jgi:hypothetical protein
VGTVAREDVEIDGAENGIRSIHFNNHGNPEKVVQIKGRSQVSYLSMYLRETVRRRSEKTASAGVI